ncbi:MAG: hypothetical protein FJY66_00560 [Calditrichaeota bacterium]|nr:hypothetical protein [Calditrichota bacterium]
MVPTIIPPHAHLIRFLFYLSAELISASAAVVSGIHSLVKTVVFWSFIGQVGKPVFRSSSQAWMLLLLFLPSLAYSADSGFKRPRDKLEVTSGWFAGGVGTGTARGLSAGSTYFAFSLVLNDHRVLTFRRSEVVEFDAFDSVEPEERSTDYGFLYGWRTSGRYAGYLSASLGLSVVESIRRGRLLYSSGCCFGESVYEEIREYTVGVPFEGQAVFKPFEVLGLGLICFGNINPKGSFLGGALSLYLGDLK